MEYDYDTPVTPTLLYAIIVHLEYTARRRLNEARALCVRCRQAYTVVCTNPACRSTVRPQHRYPRELTVGAMAERLQKRRARIAEVSRDVDALMERQRAAVRAFRDSHPRRSYAVVELPELRESRDYTLASTFRRETDPFAQNLPPVPTIGRTTVRVDLRDGTYRETTSVRVDVPLYTQPEEV